MLGVARGHEVTLFAAPGSVSPARVLTPLESGHADMIGAALHESDHVACAFDAIDAAAARRRALDVVHDHSGFTAVAMGSRLRTPVVHTLHGPFTEATSRFYRRHAHKMHLVAISESQAEHAPAGVHPAAVVPNPIAVERWPLGIEKDDYVLRIGRIGRMDPSKGVNSAIRAARLAGRRLVIAGPVQSGLAAYFRERIAPHVDGRRAAGQPRPLHRQWRIAHRVSQAAQDRRALRTDLRDVAHLRLGPEVAVGHRHALRGRRTGARSHHGARRARAAPFVVDLANVGAMAPQAMTPLLQAARRLQPDNGRVSVVFDPS